MKKLLSAVLCVLLTASVANALDPHSFFEFYSVFAPENGDVLLMPDRLIMKLTIGQSERINLLTKPEGVEVEWKCNDSNICEISQPSSLGCTVKAISKGEGEITVIDTKSHAEKTVQVIVENAVTGVELDREQITMEVGQSQMLRATAKGGEENTFVKWRINDPEKCAAISAGQNICKIKGLSAGEVKVIAEVNGYMATATVKINANYSRVGFYLSVTFLFAGAFVLIIYAWCEKKRMDKNEKRGD